MHSNGLIWNIAGYVNITGYDLKIIGKELFLSTDEWQKRYFSRQASMLIYELMHDLPKMLGKDFRSAISTLTDSPILTDELNSITKTISDYKKVNHENLKRIRNVAVAHRDKDIFEQIAVIQSINWEETINYVNQFDAIMQAIGAFLQRVMNKAAVGLDNE